MLEIDVPGQDRLALAHLVLDYNGTLALDGKPLDGVRERLDALSAALDVHVITADTFGSVAQQLQGFKVNLHLLSAGQQDVQKADYVRQLGEQSVVAMGNGRNDAAMLASARLGIALLQTEGAAWPTLQAADMVFGDINHALDALANPKRLIASLRI